MMLRGIELNARGLAEIEGPSSRKETRNIGSEFVRQRGDTQRIG